MKNPEQSRIISALELELKEGFSLDSSGHDWWHLYRVRNNSLKINLEEKGDAFIVETSALLHDISDWKFNGGDDKQGALEAEKILKKLACPLKDIIRIKEIINEVTFKGANVKEINSSIESKIVQDADRLDAIGAIGIARAFAYGGSKNRLMFDPNAKAELHESFSAYKNSKSSTINHFYEKLLLLSDKMKTTTGKKLAQSRNEYMKDFIEQFFLEWDTDSNI